MGELDGRKCLLWALVIVVLLRTSCAHREISGLLDEVRELSCDEVNALRPLFNELQMQYDVIVGKIRIGDHKIDTQLEQQHEATWQEFEQQLNNMFPQKATTFYDTTLPTVEEIMGNYDLSLMTKEQQMEYFDLQSILQDTLDEAQMNLNDLAFRALSLETNLLKLNPPTIKTLIFRAFKVGYKAASRLRRAAYCTYSHLPQLNTSLHSLHEGVDCYLYTTDLIVKIQNETVQTVRTVKKNVFQLAAVYKKVANKNSLLGKIAAVILNITKIAGNILDTISTAKHVLDSVENQLPTAAHGVVNCGSNFATKIPFIIESVSNVTACVLFVDDTSNNYEFLKPKEEYYKEVEHIVPDTVDEAANDGGRN